MTIIEELRNRKRALTVAEVADVLNVSKQEIYKLTANRKMPSFKVASSVRLDPAKIADWVKAHSAWEP